MHSDPDALAMIAMDESEVTDGMRRHLEACPECARSLASFRRIADIARDGVPTGGLAVPSPAVWSGISRELGLRADVTPVPFAETRPDGEHKPVRGRRRASRRGRAVRGRASRHPWIPLLAAAAIVVVAGGIVGAVALTRPAPTTTLAAAALDPLPTWTGSSGDAVVEETSDGTREVMVTVTAPPTSDGFREVWLLTPDLEKLISIGVLTGDSATFALPDDVDLTEYSVVDVSEEGLDGDPGHSGDSIVRGSLTS